MYKDAKSRVEDVKSTAWSFAVVGVLGLVFLILLDLDVLPFHLMTHMKILMSVVMGLVFSIFLVIGIVSFFSLKKVAQNADSPANREKEIMEWFLQNYAEALRNYRTADMDPSEPESLYYPRYEKMCELIREQFGPLPSDFREHIVEALYEQIFAE